MKTIPLTQGFSASVDDVDFAHLSQFKWYAAIANGKVYAQRNIRVRVGRGGCVPLKMHRVISGASKGEVVDHADGDTLNNQRVNLRVCRPKDNARHLTRLPITNTSGAIGVIRCSGKSARPWRARIGVDGKRLHLGYFDSVDGASTAYRDAAVRYFGVFAPNV